MLGNHNESDKFDREPFKSAQDLLRAEEDSSRNLELAKSCIGADFGVGLTLAINALRLLYKAHHFKHVLTAYPTSIQDKELRSELIDPFDQARAIFGRPVQCSNLIGEILDD